jgi:hypothetical protein
MTTDRYSSRVNDPILAGVGDAIALTRDEPALARAKLAALWATVGEAGDALHRCAIAHAMADVCESVDDELVWDLRALDAGVLLDDAHLEAAGMAASVEGLLSSLHLNLADVYRRLGNTAKAREHVAASTAAIASLAGDGYSDMMRTALSRITFSLPHVHGPHCGHDEHD